MSTVRELGWRSARLASAVPARAPTAEAGEQVAVACSAQPYLVADGQQQDRLHAVKDAVEHVRADQPQGLGAAAQRSRSGGDVRQQSRGRRVRAGGPERLAVTDGKHREGRQAEGDPVRRERQGGRSEQQQDTAERRADDDAQGGQGWTEPR